MVLRSVNPATGEVLETFPEMTPAALDQLLAATDVAWRDWRRRSYPARADCVRAAAGALRAGRARLARCMTLEMGKPITQAEDEVEKCAWACEFFAEHAEALLAPERVATEARASFVRYDPLGPVLAIMPWNFPLWQVFRFAAPALMAGNGAVLKHASNVSRCALEIEAIWREAGCPEHLFRTALIGAAHVGRLVADARIRAVTLTGSEQAGIEVASQAGHALKKTVLELGGSDPFIVLEDADVEQAAVAAANARLVNSGQSCIAAKRFIPVDSVADRFVARFVDEMRTRRMGDPLDRATAVGPLARHDLREALHRQVEASVRRGARLELGGQMPDGPGAFYPPTVLTAAHPGMPAFDEETFGPVAAVTRARDAAHAIELANASAFGLGASLWTADGARAERLAAEIEAGVVFVNGSVRSDPRLPFGGVKRSGYGRELGEHGIREFVNVKTVWLA